MPEPLDSGDTELTSCARDARRGAVQERRERLPGVGVQRRPAGSEDLKRRAGGGVFQRNMMKHNERPLIVAIERSH